MIGEESGITIGLALLIAAAVGALWWRVETRAGKAAAYAAKVERELLEYKRHVSETFMPREQLSHTMGRVEAEIRGLRVDLKEELNKLGDRIERMENHVLSDR